MAVPTDFESHEKLLACRRLYTYHPQAHPRRVRVATAQYGSPPTNESQVAPRLEKELVTNAHVLASP